MNRTRMEPPVKERIVVEADFIDGYDGITQFGLGCWQGTKAAGPSESGSPASRCAPHPAEAAFVTIKTAIAAAPLVVSPPEVGNVVEARDNNGNELVQTPWQTFKFALSLPSASWTSLTLCSTSATPTSPLIESRIRLYPREEPPYVEEKKRSQGREPIVRRREEARPGKRAYPNPKLPAGYMCRVVMCAVLRVLVILAMAITSIILLVTQLFSSSPLPSSPLGGKSYSTELIHARIVRRLVHPFLAGATRSTPRRHWTILLL